jgi:hypothetical protein
MLSVAFIEKLLARLKNGDARSIHLNALPANFARLDVYDLMNIEPSLHLKFLDNLLKNRAFKFSITIDPTSLNNKTPEEKKIIQRIIKRLNHLDYQEKEEFAEHGYHSFGFGYPLLIKRDSQHPEKIIKAPLLIWYLNIEKDTHRNNTWTISRTDEHPLVFNELLQAHFENIEQIKTDELERLLEDDFISEMQLNIFCKQLLDKLNIPFDADNNIATLLPCTNKETIENITKETAWIRWSGVLGLYKMQKQSIIKDMELLLNQKQDFQSNDVLYFDGEVLAPTELDPSQEHVLQQLSTNNTIVIQGPPGTGKSQSLTAVITQALLNNKKVLVVCEKRTAMEVLYNNLKKEQLHHLCVMVEDVYRDRKNIVDAVRDKIENSAQPLMRFRANEYELLRTKFLTLQEEVNHRILFGNTATFGDDNWSELISKVVSLNANTDIYNKANTLNKQIRSADFTFTYEEFLLLLGKIKTAHNLFLQIKKEAFIFDSISTQFYLNDTDEQRLGREIETTAALGTHLESQIITESITKYGDNYDIQKGLRTWWVLVLSFFFTKYKIIIQKKNDTKISLQKLIAEINKNNFFATSLSSDDIAIRHSNVLPKLSKLNQTFNHYTQQIKSLPAYFFYKKFIQQQNTPIQNIIEALSKSDTDDWEAVFTNYYLNQTVLKLTLSAGVIENTTALLMDLQQVDKLLKCKISDKIKMQWEEQLRQLMSQREATALRYLYNQRKNKQYDSKNSLRKIIYQDFEFFSTIFPVIMVNPSVCTSILPLKPDLFDFIILDEASQLRLEDTYSSLLRGRTKIISGDKHQMPPSNFFGSEVLFWSEEEQEINNGTDEFLAGSKSLLEYAEDANYKSTYLDYHYRSLHPQLIQFSNHAFYQSRLVPMPAKQPYQPVHYYNVEGTYIDGTNLIEATAVADFIFNFQFNDDTIPSVGIATFNIFQRNLILDKLYEMAYADKNKNERLQQLLNHGLFVKNLENIQGDERDMLILSTTFGRDKEGKFRQAFGPLTQEKGYQLLNVIITRAKHSLYVFTSIPEAVFTQFEAELLQKGNSGKSIFYAYLTYAKACMENNSAQLEFIISTLQKNSKQLSTTTNNDEQNILKKQVYTMLKKSLPDYTVSQNYGLGGFVLDVVIFKNNHPVLTIDFEPNHLYHSEVAYRIKLHRQQIIAKYGIETYHLWSFNWWRDSCLEIENISKAVNLI